MVQDLCGVVGQKGDSPLWAARAVYAARREGGDIVSGVSTHVLDAVSGGPAAGVPVVLTGADDAVVASATTDSDGRAGGLGSDSLEPGTYRLRFDTATYFAANNVASFYPEIVIAFELTDATAKYHVPLLLSPYAYSTYRGS